MKTITSTLAAALIASASFAGVALAGGDYYEGAWPSQKADTQHQVQRAHQSGSYGYTGSISRAAGQDLVAGKATVNSGDYYDGANRPN